MRINHNIAALNTHRQLNAANSNQSKSMEKLSSGLRINRAGDDAAGLAISEKMRAQVRGLDQASSNAQDGISLIQTAEGALSETHSILQRMRELATQAANDTNVGVDRNEIQKEINQLSSEINRVGNTTEFNTQSLLKGDNGVNIAKTGLDGIADLSGGKTEKTQATSTFTVAELASTKTTNSSTTFSIQGKEFVVNLEHDATSKAVGTIGDHTLDSTNTTATIKYVTAGDTTGTATKVDDTAVSDKVAKALQAMIDADSELKGQYTVKTDGNQIEIKANKNGNFDGSAGFIGAVAGGGTEIATTAVAASAGTTTITNATTGIDLAGKASADLVGKGLTINGQAVEFYNADNGVYQGEAIGINVGSGKTGADLVTQIADQLNSKVTGVRIEQDAITDTQLNITADALGELGNGITVKDGGVQDNFKATFQVGANKGQSMTISIADMRSEALGITAKAGTEGFTSSNAVTDGTNNTEKEAALDVSTHEKASAAIKVINDAIEKVSAQRSNLGAFQNRLDHTINNLGTSSENLTAAESRIRDVDMAKEMMNQTRESILAQASQAMLAQANQKPQSVLQLLQ